MKNKQNVGKNCKAIEPKGERNNGKKNYFFTEWKEKT